jgi:glycosyltransferase involved in cell wall biosynthesis
VVRLHTVELLMQDDTPHAEIGDMSDLDVLYISYNRPDYVRLTLPRLLETCPQGSRVWVWHNGPDADVLAVIRDYLEHPRLYKFNYSEVNVGLRPALNWLWSNAEGTYLSKVDDDSLMEPGWIEWLTGCLEQWEGFGVLGTWRFEPEDFDAVLSAPKIAEFGGVRMLQNHWVQGSGHAFRRQLVGEFGVLKQGQSFTAWCLDVARGGFVNGWPMPFKREEHLDDPRHPLTLFIDEESFKRNRPLSALSMGAHTLSDWADQMRRSARQVQSAPLHMEYYFGWRPRLRNAVKRSNRLTRRLRGRLDWRAP